VDRGRPERGQRERDDGEPDPDRRQDGLHVPALAPAEPEHHERADAEQHGSRRRGQDADRRLRGRGPERRDDEDQADSDERTSNPGLQRARDQAQAMSRHPVDGEENRARQYEDEDRAEADRSALQEVVLRCVRHQ